MNKLLKTLIIIFCINFCFCLKGNCQFRTDSKLLLSDQLIQFEITEAVNLMYNFKFQKAEKQFTWLKQMHPKHPLPYLLLGLSEFWKILPNQDIKKYDDEFFSYMDSVIYYGEKLYEDSVTRSEAIFFLAAAYAFKGRLHSDRKNWRKAINTGRKALRYLKESRKYEHLSPEFLFGEGLYHYFSNWIPENYAALRPIMWFFPKGNKEKGIEYLEKASRNAFYTRVQSQLYLIKIYLIEDKEKKALPYAEYLHQTFPDNAYFSRYYARVLHSLGHFGKCEKISKEIIKKLEKGMTGYETTSGRYASFFLGWINYNRNEKDTARKYFTKTIKYSRKLDAMHKGYTLYAFSKLAKIAHDNGDQKKAIEYYEKVVEYGDNDDDNYKEARKYLKKHKKQGKKSWFNWGIF